MAELKRTELSVRQEKAILVGVILPGSTADPRDPLGELGSLAKTAGAGGKTWRAYLSTSTVDAKSRIGNGPWYNFKGELIAQSLADLHTADKNKISGTTALTEKGTAPNYLAAKDGNVAPIAQPLQHDILTGTNEDGTKNADTCRDWTVGDASAKAMLGHADRLGRNPGLNSWNAIHASQGCGQEQLQPTGGAGMLYCFASN